MRRRIDVDFLNAAAVSPGRLCRGALIGLMLPLAACAGTAKGVAPAAASAPVAEQASADSIMRVAEMTRAKGDLAIAAGLYQRAHEAAPGKVAPLVELGATLADMNAAAGAAEAYRAALALEPRNAAALRGLGAALIELREPEQAIAQFEAALDVSEDYRLYNDLGVAHDMLGERQAAQAYYRRGLGLAPDNLQLANNLGLSLALAGKYGEAIALLERVARDPAATAVHRQNLALAYGLAGRRDAARQIGRLDLDPAAVQKNLGYYDVLRGIGDGRAAAGAVGTHLLGAGS